MNPKMRKIKSALLDSFREFALERQHFARQAEMLYAPEVDTVVRERSKDSKRIERLLDSILGFCFDSDMLLLYKKLCRYYFQIDPQATAFYVYAYRDMWDDQDKEGRGNRTTGNAGKRQRRQIAPKKLKMKI
ncbi:MAG: hypothetical protein Q8N95_05865 [Desulfobacterales bacterium]|nr:hypothetical protein [Desulfobacterales bacterium]